MGPAQSAAPSPVNEPEGRNRSADQQAAYQPSYLPPWATGTTLGGSQVADLLSGAAAPVVAPSG
jgi:hypothetical protein